MYRSSDDHLDKLFMCILEHGEHVAHDAATRQLQGATCQMGSSYGLSGVEVGELPMKSRRKSSSQPHPLLHQVRVVVLHHSFLRDCTDETPPCSNLQPRRRDVQVGATSQSSRFCRHIHDTERRTWVAARAKGPSIYLLRWQAHRLQAQCDARGVSCEGCLCRSDNVFLWPWPSERASVRTSCCRRSRTNFSSCVTFRAHPAQPHKR